MFRVASDRKARLPLIGKGSRPVFADFAAKFGKVPGNGCGGPGAIRSGGPWANQNRKKISRVFYSSRIKP